MQLCSGDLKEIIWHHIFQNTRWMVFAKTRVLGRTLAWEMYWINMLLRYPLFRNQLTLLGHRFAMPKMSFFLTLPKPIDLNAPTLITIGLIKRQKESNYSYVFSSACDLYIKQKTVIHKKIHAWNREITLTPLCK